jgi:2-polyprenyl-3-methyl-5-hydroxy-6-metoxy-1,4-benzoquinol methylase
MQFSYDRWHAARAPDQGDEAPWHRLVLECLSERPELISGRSILEIGCGRGGLSCQMARWKPALHVAADFSLGALEVARRQASRLGLEHIRWEQQDVQRISWPNESFDLIISCETVEHVQSVPKALGEFARLLKPNGRLVLTTPNYLGGLGLYRLYLALRGRRYAEEGQEINRWMFLPVTLLLLRRAGLAVERVDGVGHYAYLPGASPRRLHSLDRARALTRWTAVHSFVIARKE